MAALLVWAGAVQAQEPVVDFLVAEACQAEGKEARACVGRISDQCIKEGGGAQVTYGFCYGAELDYWDGLLNQLYGKVLAASRALDASGEAPPIAVERLRDMQRAWIDVRDARCDVVGLSYRGGTGAGPGGTECRMRATAEQVTVLRGLRDRLE